MKTNEKGFTVPELLISLLIVGILIILTFPSLKGFMTRLEIKEALRTAVIAMNTARYHSVRHNRKVKLTVSSNKFILMTRELGQWKEFKRFDIADGINASINANPVFSPMGDVSPLCSIYIYAKQNQYKISIAMAGRIKIVNLSP